MATPREWVFVQLGRKWSVREDGWKLNEAGESRSTRPTQRAIVGND